MKMTELMKLTAEDIHSLILVDQKMECLLFVDYAHIDDLDYDEDDLDEDGEPLVERCAFDVWYDSVASIEMDDNDNDYIAMNDDHQQTKGYAIPVTTMPMNELISLSADLAGANFDGPLTEEECVNRFVCIFAKLNQ